MTTIRLKDNTKKKLKILKTKLKKKSMNSLLDEICEKVDNVYMTDFELENHFKNQFKKNKRSNQK